MHLRQGSIRSLVALLIVALLVAASSGQGLADDLPVGFTDGVPVGEDGQDQGSSSHLSIQAAATTQRYFGRDPFNAVLQAAAATPRSCTITDEGLAALVLAPVFKESSAATTPSSAPSPMTLSRYDEWTGTFSTTTNRDANYGLYAFRDPNTAYQRAYWHPGIGIWQYDSAGVGAPFTAIERMDVGIMAADVAKGMATRYCNATGTDQAKRYAAWAPWGNPCTLCQDFFWEMTSTAPRFQNITLVDGISTLGGAVPRSCTLANQAVPCWYVEPRVGVIQGATAWATFQPDGGSGPTVAPAPLSLPFYVVDRGTHEERHWLRADTGYGIDISASRTIGQNARPRSGQPLSGLAWSTSSTLCDRTFMRGACTPVPPAFMTSAQLSIGGTYRPFPLDANGDGRGDILWYAPGPAADSLWIGQGSGGFTSIPLSVNGTYEHVRIGDFDANGADDILWYTPTSSLVQIWWANGDGTFVGSQHVVGTGLEPIVLDADGDRKYEVIWYGPGPTTDFRWDWSGVEWVAAPLTVNGTYRPLVGDFDDNGRDDVLWWSDTAPIHPVWLYRQAGGYLSIDIPGSVGSSPSVGDFDGDGFDDIFWYGPGSAPDGVSFGAPGGAFDRRAVSVSGIYQPLVADLDGDGADDVFWYAPGPPADSLWRWGPGRVPSSTSVGVSSNHQAIIGTFSAAGGDGILWYAPGPEPDVVWYR